MYNVRVAYVTTMKDFYNLLINTLIAGVTTSFLWFALTFWAYLETRSVLATAIIGGSYMLMMAVTGIFFGTLVDRHKKKTIMLGATVITALAYAFGGVVYLLVPESQLLRLGGGYFWLFVIVILCGAIVENIRNIAMSTCVTLMVPAKRRDKANGMVGAAMGLSFAITSVFSGLVIGTLGMGWALGLAIGLTAVSLLHLLFVRIPEQGIAHDPTLTKHIDIPGAWAAIRAVPGLFWLIIFSTFNNLLGGVFMSLMDAYGLSIVSVETWGLLWGVLSFAFMVGGVIVAKKGLGARPLRLLLLANVVMWVVSIGFTLRESIWLMAAGMFIYLLLIPVVEAAEQTAIQRVVPYQKQGRVFGLAQSFEAAAAPITAFLIGPIAQFGLIPYMQSDAGQQAFGWLLGSGNARGIALVFVIAGVIGLAVTLWAFTTRAYHTLSAAYADA